MGRPVQMDVPARFTAGDTEECVRADVFHGETRMAATRVRTAVSRPLEQRGIGVESDAPVAEPLFTVPVGSGCHDTITSNFALLPEFRRVLAVADARTVMADPTPVAPLSESTDAASPPRGATAAVAAPPRQEIAALRQRLDSGTPWYAAELLVKLLALLALLVLVAAAVAGVLGYRARQARRWEEAWYELAEPADTLPADDERVVGEVVPRSVPAPIAAPATPLATEQVGSATGAADIVPAAPQPVQVVAEGDVERRRQEEAAQALGAVVTPERVPASRY